MPRVYIFAHEVFVHKNCIRHAREFSAVFGKNFVPVRDTSVMKYRVYNEPDRER